MISHFFHVIFDFINSAISKKSIIMRTTGIVQFYITFAIDTLVNLLLKHSSELFRYRKKVFRYY